MQAQLPSETLREVVQGVGRFLPNLLAAAVLIVAGFLLARFLRAVTTRAVRSWSRRLLGRLGRLLRSKDMQKGIGSAEVERPAADVIGAIVFWVVLLLFLAAASETLGLSIISAWLGGVGTYLPRVLAAVVIFILGLLAGNLARNAIGAAASSAGIGYAPIAGRAAQIVIVMVSSVMAFDQLGIEITFLTVTIAIATSTTFGGAALAFGLGARTAVSNIIASYYIGQTYRVGHRVRIGGVEGGILEITATAVVLETPEGRVLVPAKEFSEQTSVLLPSQT